MTLHDTAEFSKKAGIVLSISLGVILLLTVIFKIGGAIHAILFPPKIPSANEAYGKIPPLTFPKSTINGQFTYSINTLNGTLPQDFPDRLIIYPMVINQPNLLNLDVAKQNVIALGFLDQSGNPLHEIPLGGPNYEWRESTGFQRQIIYNIITQDFTMSSNYLTSLLTLSGQGLGDQTNAVATVKSFLDTINAFPSDIDQTLTQNPNPNNDYTTSPQLYSIANGQLTPTTSLSDAQAIRVNLYQKEIDYSVIAGINHSLTNSQNFSMKLPILYPHPPYSTMNFIIGSNGNQSQVLAVNFHHQAVNLNPTKQATYPIKTPQQAFTDLKNGKGYIAAYNGTDNQILINKVYLAYYIGTTQQQYLMPVIVFEGQNGFFAYVSAVEKTAIQ